MAQHLLKKLHLEYVGAPTRFLERYPCPWLILSPHQRPKSDLALKTMQYYIDGKLPDDDADSDATEMLSELSAVQVAKRSINAFALGITVGRTKNNDIYVNDERISRFHAYFRQQEGDWVICDAGSRNGTFVDGERLDPRRTRALADQAVVDFGGYRTRFFKPALFQELVSKLTPRTPAKLP